MSDRQRFERLHAEHASAVQAYARRRIDRATADDVVSEVFLTAWRRNDQAPDDPRAWLLGIARRVLANQRRSSERQVALFERMSETRPQHDDLQSDHRHPDVLLALAALKPADRELLLLMGWDELTPAQAAHVHQIRPSTLSMRLKRARRRLTDQLERHAPPHAPTTSREEPSNA